MIGETTPYPKQTPQESSRLCKNSIPEGEEAGKDKWNGSPEVSQRQRVKAGRHIVPSMLLLPAKLNIVPRQ